MDAPRSLPGGCGGNNASTGCRVATAIHMTTSGRGGWESGDL